MRPRFVLSGVTIVVLAAIGVITLPLIPDRPGAYELPNAAPRVVANPDDMLPSSDAAISYVMGKLIPGLPISGAVAIAMTYGEFLALEGRGVRSSNPALETQMRAEPVWLVVIRTVRTISIDDLGLPLMGGGGMPGISEAVGVSPAAFPTDDPRSYLDNDGITTAIYVLTAASGEVRTVSILPTKGWRRQQFDALLSRSTATPVP